MVVFAQSFTKGPTSASNAFFRKSWDEFHCQTDHFSFIASETFFLHFSIFLHFCFTNTEKPATRPRQIVLGNFWRLEHLFPILATLSNFWLSEQPLSDFDV